jgi:hypothetical protein
VVLELKIENKIQHMQKDSQVLPFWKEITAGLISAFFVSPTNAILDKSVIEYANGKATVS